MSDSVFIKGLVLHAYHGVMQHEAKVGQTFRLDLTLAIDLAEASRSDQLKHTVSYDLAVKAASEAFVARRYRLVEAAAGAVAEAFIALGGNVGDVRASFDRAIALLCEDGAVQLTARSADYRTPPWGVTDQPPFTNAVIAVATSLAPHALLARMQACERTLGRDRAHERHWGPRRIDLDLLAYDDVALHDSDLTLPHPHLFERAFVLAPLAEIAADRVIGGMRVRDSLARVGAGGIEKLPQR